MTRQSDPAADRRNVLRATGGLAALSLAGYLGGGGVSDGGTDDGEADDDSGAPSDDGDDAEAPVVRIVPE